MSETFDQEELMEELDGDREFLDDSLGMLDADAPGMIEQIRQAIDRGDSEGVRTGAHTVKSMVGNFCAKPAFDAALHLETIGREGDLATSGDALQSLETEIDRLRKALRQFLNELP